jgi:hypothetical protein
MKGMHQWPDYDANGEKRSSALAGEDSAEFDRTPTTFRLQLSRCQPYPAITCIRNMRQWSGYFANG